MWKYCWNVWETVDARKLPDCNASPVCYRGAFRDGPRGPCSFMQFLGVAANERSKSRLGRCGTGNGSEEVASRGMKATGNCSYFAFQHISACHFLGCQHVPQLLG